MSGPKRLIPKPRWEARNDRTRAPRDQSQADRVRILGRRRSWRSGRRPPRCDDTLQSRGGKISQRRRFVFDRPYSHFKITQNRSEARRGDLQTCGWPKLPGVHLWSGFGVAWFFETAPGMRGRSEITPATSKRRASKRSPVMKAIKKMRQRGAQ